MVDQLYQERNVIDNNNNNQKGLILTDVSEEGNNIQENEFQAGKSICLTVSNQSKPFKLMETLTKVQSKDSNELSITSQKETLKETCTFQCRENILQTFNHKRKFSEDVKKQKKKSQNQISVFQKPRHKFNLQVQSFNSYKINKTQSENNQQSDDSINLSKIQYINNTTVQKESSPIKEIQSNLNNLKECKQQKYHKYEQKLNLIKDSKISNLIQKIIFGQKFCKRRNDNTQINTQQCKQKIQCQIERDLDIYQFYQDILFLKKAIMILLSQEQLAAIKQVGCTSKFLELGMDQIKSGASQQGKHMSYFEEQFAIFLSDDLSQKYFEKFLVRSQNKTHLSSTDQRIISSISSSIFD
ncbi:hypothetical protein ABPG73_004182 [Tetrahymena malaccensis]